MGGGVGKRVAMGAGVSGGSANAVEEGLKDFAESGSELGQGAPPVPRETPFGLVDGRGADAQHPVDGVVLDGGLDRAGVDGLDGCLIVVLLHDPVGEEVRDRRVEL